MFPDRSYQIQMIKDELFRKRHLFRYKSTKKETFSKIVKEKARQYVALFLETSSIHGLNHFVAARRHPSEVLLWLVMVMISVFGAVYLSWTTWIRYQSSPTVVSMDRDMFAWNTTFPCVTICPSKRVDQDKLDLYIRNSDAKDKNQLEAFIKVLANADYKNLDENMLNYDGLAPDNYLDVILNVSVIFKPTLTIGATGINLQVVPTITEMGLCFSLNSQVAVYNSPEYRKANRWDIMEARNDTFYIHPLDGEVFATAVNLSTSYDVYIHGPLEMPDIASKVEHSAKNFYLKIYVTAIAVYTTPDAAKLKVAQRRCRFHHENNLKHNSIYTYNLCRMECRIRLCLKYCQCIPHFYRRVGDEKICDVKGLQCLALKKEELYKLTDESGRRVDCGCLSNCDDVNYIIQSNRSVKKGSQLSDMMWSYDRSADFQRDPLHRIVLQPWFLGTNLQWGLVTYPRLRYRRDIIFGFTDVLVAVGGMAGLFLGCSVLSFMEIIYFLTLRLVCYTHATIKK